jgi:hypothetical protein
MKTPYTFVCHVVVVLLANSLSATPKVGNTIWQYYKTRQPGLY